ncbi:phosphatidylinositol alpha-1,6-mannosyltransferase [Verrucomicrobium sp. GAS474]|uniref:glycosyltransferase family 4 protein n=1 Tax=Verrucomicrobium sp. GAS474 TaxID=1882831 RepID=UPI00087C6624|nr:glycosyltransferase family 4 protein [Verrucomicrobium sp. GAS474]SDU23084.1 phosphatidylinositol alpha-1,6-mannosyltransferase [Verrucomicrobium sp. GAS474]
MKPAWPSIVITHEYAPFRGGAGTFCAEVANAAFAAGIPVEVWAPGAVSAEDRRGVPVRRLGGRGSLRFWDQARFMAALWWRRREFRGKRLFLGSVGAHLAFLYFHRFGLLREVDAVPVFHGSEALRYRRSPGMFRAARRWLAGRAVYSSSRCAARLVEESGLLTSGQKVVVAPCALREAIRIDADRLLQEEAASPRAPLEIRPFRILTLARLHPRKGQIDTARALALLPSEVRRGLVYEVGGAGDPSYLREIQRVCREGNVPFAYLGEIPEGEMAGAFARCDLYVMSSRSLARSVEGFGMTYLEAGALGKAVVGYRSGGVDEAVKDGETGLLVEEGDVTALSKVLARLISDEALRARMGAAGKEWARKPDWTASARILFS